MRRRALAHASSAYWVVGEFAASTMAEAAVSGPSEHRLFGTFRLQSGSGGSYGVEVRSPDAFINSCGSIDHRVNGLGTCKHIEGALAALERRGARALRAAAAKGNAAPAAASLADCGRCGVRECSPEPPRDVVLRAPILRAREDLLSGIRLDQLAQVHEGSEV